MDFISWFFTHVSHVISITLMGRAGQGGDNSEGGDVPVQPMEVAQMQQDRPAGGDPVSEGPLFFVITQKVTDIDCAQSDTESQQRGKVRVKWRESEEMSKHHATS